MLDRSLPLDDVKARVKEIIGSPSKVVFDAISSSETQKFGFNLVDSGGQLGVVLEPAMEPTDGKKIAAIVGIKQLPHNVEMVRELYAKLPGLLEDGTIKVCSPGLELGYLR